MQKAAFAWIMTLQRRKSVDHWVAKKCQSVEKSEPNLSTILLEPVKHRLESGLTESTVDSTLHVVFITLTQTLRPVIECIPEGFVDAFESVATSHEHLGKIENQRLCCRRVIKIIAIGTNIEKGQ